MMRPNQKECVGWTLETVIEKEAAA
jgi:hypothetical protein